MDKIEELEKYKKLLDDGAITEDEFRLMKQKILGLKTDDEKAAEKQAEREQALAEIEKMREEKRRAQEEAQARELAEKQRQEAARQWQIAEQNRLIQEERQRQDAARQAEQNRINQMQLQQTYNEEKAKEAARAQEMKIRQERNQKMQGTVKTAASVLKTVLLWIVTVFLILYTLGAFGTGGIKYVLNGIDSLLLAVLCCPLIAKKVKSIPKVEQYYGIKKIITIVLVILFFVIIIV